ncbi:Serine/threonine-protein phosphatase 6 regulatory ankyrin repeat subunit C [Labeo rohita]|uniref:Serine/threonine-protein phosphatase 6 regulatory ankyrin repeat subunit C n=1 Tax=Labeo rohita TaxID=84645 RepID=A0ABQ8L201_LABRO|nr:Serine/threonine-protein phosphatase 6 regulatory ankyrin repeat subunit C [Labeo rohita]
MVDFLLEQKEDINELDQECRTALHAAAYVGGVYIMDLLISSGADVNAKDQEWLTPLHRAAASQNERSVELLLRKGAEVNAQDRFCQTALHVAAASRAIKCVDILIPYVNSLNVADRFGRTAVHHAVHSGHAETVTLLLNKGANMSARDIKDRQPIHLAAYLGRLEVVKLLVACSADVSCRDKQGFTPLHAAALGGHTEVVKYLLKHGAEIDESDRSGNSALHMVCYAGQEFVASALVNCGASVNHSNVQGCTPLHLSAASADGALCLELLVNNGADVNIPNKDGKSPLHMAAIHGHFTRSQILIQNGAKVKCVDKYGNTPLHSAAKHGHELLISLLLNNGGDVARCVFTKPFKHKGYCGRTDTLEWFDINTVDSLGRTCLHIAASGGNVECLKLLLNSGADLSKKDYFGRSPLHYTSVNGSYLCTVALVKAGADVNELDNCPDRQSSSDSDEEAQWCLEFLLHSGADPSLRDSKGFSPVHYAASCGDRHNLKFVSHKEMSFKCVEDVESCVPVSPFHLAAYNGHNEALQVLSETLVNVDIQDSRGHTALYMAALRAANGQTDCLLMMLKRAEKNDIIDLMDVHGQKGGLGTVQCRVFIVADPTQLRVFSVADPVKVRVFVIADNTQSSSSQVPSSTFNGICRTPLMLATLGSHIDCVHMLLERGSNPDTGDRRSRTALHRALYWCMEPLLCAGTFMAEPPLHLAASCGHAGLLHPFLHAALLSDPLDSLLDYSAYTPTHWAAYHDILLHQARTDLSLLDINRNSALHIACRRSQEMCALLILAEIDEPSLINTTNTALQTPLHIAARNGLATVVEVLLTRGATVLAIDKDGHTPALACAPNKDVADCLALIISTMMPFSAGTSCGISLMKHCGIAASHQPLSNSVPIQLITEEPQS